MWDKIQTFIRKFVPVNRAIEVTCIFVTALATVGMFFVAYVGVIISKDVAKMTSDSVKISTKLAQQDLIKLQSELRPYLIIQLMPGENEGLQKDGNSQLSLACIDNWHFILPFKLKNVGKVPAINIEAKYITPTQELSFAIDENSVSPDAQTSETFRPWPNISNQVKNDKPFNISLKVSYKGNNEIDSRTYYSFLTLSVIRKVQNIYEVKKVESKFGYENQGSSVIREAENSVPLNSFQDASKESDNEDRLKWLREGLIPFYTLFCVFVIFVYQEINSRIRTGYNNFRDWVKYRLDEKKDEAVLLKALGMDKEPYSWLEKDVIFQIFYFYKKVHHENITPYMKASKDYYFYIKEYLRFKKHIFISLLILTLLMIIIIGFQWNNLFILAGYYSLIILFIMWTFVMPPLKQGLNLLELALC